MTEKHTHGGAGRGQGNKPTHGDRVFISGFFTDAKLAHKFEAVLHKTGKSRTDFFNEAIKKATDSKG